MGQCRRFPQIVTKHQADWCGEFSAAQPVVEPIEPLPQGSETLGWPSPPVEEAPRRRGRPPKAKQ